MLHPPRDCYFSIWTTTAIIRHAEFTSPTIPPSTHANHRIHARTAAETASADQSGGGAACEGEVAWQNFAAEAATTLLQTRVRGAGKYDW